MFCSPLSQVGATAGALSGGAAGYGAYAKRGEIQVLGWLKAILKNLPRTTNQQSQQPFEQRYLSPKVKEKPE